MVLYKRILFTFLMFYEILWRVSGQEYLKDLKPKEFKFISDDELPPVELPRPMIPERASREVNDEQSEEELPIHESRAQKSQRPSLMDVVLEASVREGLNAMRHLYMEVEPNMVKNGQLLQDNHPAALLSKFSAPVVETTKREMAAYATLAAAKAFRKSYDLNSDLARQAHSPKVSLRRTALESLCPPRDPPTCMPASERYRTHDGTCNNKKRPRWGAAQMPFNRFLPPEYGDGVDTTRKAADGAALSSSRFVSLLVHGAKDGEAPLTLMLAQWGQLLDHDMTSTAQPRSINGSVPSCCGRVDFHPSCFPIKVPLDDPWLSQLKIRCLEFLRSAPAQRRDCVLSWREQTNQATSYIDASPIYSSSVKSSDNARVFRKGLLIFGRGSPSDDVCQHGAIATHCIRSGDGRSSEQPGLLALHHVWVHEHNHIAMKLSEMNLHWSDEKIYQETRRIIGAMFQHITYREFLPIVLGREVVRLFELELLTTGYFDGYDPKINPTVANAFAAAAFRFGHSLVQNSYLRCDRFHNVLSNNVSLHEEFQIGDIGSVGSLHRLIRGMATQKALKRDEFITPELTNHLFQTPGFPFGLDLAAINIQRGRDHGLPPYTSWRVPCGLSPINTWEEFVVVVGPDSAQRISHAYHSVHDIDLFVGGIAERPVVGGLVGPTFACIIAQQFSNSRKGDRFWYENDGFESSFTPAQLHSIRRVSLASVLCRAVGGGTFQPHIFLPPHLSNNERLPCGVAPLDDFDIGPWLEQDPFASLDSTHTEVQQSITPTFQLHTVQTTFKPQTLTDRIFNVVPIETKIPENTNSHLSNIKVGFSNRNPAVTAINDFIPNASSDLFTKISDKLDLKHKVSQGHITKQKPVPGVSNKLDRKNHKGGNRHGVLPNPTRRTVIVNNIPIELRNAGQDKGKKIPTNKEGVAEPRIGSANIMADTEDTECSQSKTEAEVLNVEEQMKNGTSDLKTITEITKTELENDLKINEDQDVNEDNLLPYRGLVEQDTEIIPNMQDELNNTESLSTANDNLTSLVMETKKLNSNELRTDLHKNISSILNDKINFKLHNKSEQKDLKEVMNSEMLSTEFHKQTENVNKITRTNNNVPDYELKNVTSTLYSTKDLDDSDIDPMFQTTPIEHKRVQRKLVRSTSTDQIKGNLKLKLIHNEFTRNTTRILANNNRTATTKSPKISRTTLRTVELRQYQGRPPFTRTPQKVIVDTVNGNNQYEIEINIRQTNRNPKPQPSTSHIVDYTNAYKPNHIDRYTSIYQTTPIYAYYQPAPTQISSVINNHRTKPPTIIFVNEHDEQKTTNLPGFLQGIVGWSLSTKRPLPASIGFNDKPDHETIIGSPHSTAPVQPAYQKPPSHLALPAISSSFSQSQLNTAGIAQASSASVSNGNFGSIAGFASANGADSTFSFNIRPKPVKSQQSSIAGNYGLGQPQRNPWNEAHPPTGQHISTYELPYRDNIYSPFSTYNSQKYYTANKKRPQRKESLTLTPAGDFTDFDYAERTLSNVTSDEETVDIDEDYEYDEDYGTLPFIRNLNQGDHLRPGNETDTTMDSLNLTTTKNQTMDDNYVLPALNITTNLLHNLPTNVPQSTSINFSTDFPDALARHLQKDILAEDDDNTTKTSPTNNQERVSDTISQVKADVLRHLQRKRKINRNKNNKRNHEKIAFAPINILTKPERPDNWVIFDSPHQLKGEASLPQTPELVMDLVPSDEIPKPLKENIWLDLSKIKKKLGFNSQELVRHVDPETDFTITKHMNLKKQDIKNQDSLKHTTTTELLLDSKKSKSNFTSETVTDTNAKDLETLTATSSTLT